MGNVIINKNTKGNVCLIFPADYPYADRKTFTDIVEKYSEGGVIPLNKIAKETDLSIAQVLILGKIYDIEGFGYTKDEDV